MACFPNSIFRKIPSSWKSSERISVISVWFHRQDPDGPVVKPDDIDGSRIRVYLRSFAANSITSDTRVMLVSAIMRLC